MVGFSSSRGSGWVRDGKVTAAASRMLLTRRDDHALVDQAAAVGARNSHLATTEPGAELDAPPPRPAGRRATGCAFEVPLSAGQVFDAVETHPDLGMLTQPHQAADHRAVTAAPAAGYRRRLDRVETNSGPRHGPSLAPPAA